MADSLLRHTVYVGLREDKPAELVRGERWSSIGPPANTVFGAIGVLLSDLDYRAFHHDMVALNVSDQPLSGRERMAVNMSGRSDDPRSACFDSPGEWSPAAQGASCPE